MGIADHSCAPAPSRAILPEEAVGAGALDSPFGERRGFEVLQGCVDVPYGKRCAMVR